MSNGLYYVVYFKQRLSWYSMNYLFYNNKSNVETFWFYIRIACTWQSLQNDQVQIELSNTELGMVIGMGIEMGIARQLSYF